MAGKFDIRQLLNSASIQAGEKDAADAERVTPLKVIPLKISDLMPSKDNFYSVDKIAELKTSIEMFGVVQPLAVKPLPAGKYEIIAGHRRHRACMELVAEGKVEFEYIPCGIRAERDEIKERILLIMTNSTTRELSDWEKMKQAEELQKHFTTLKKRENLPGRVRDLVAEALNTSSTQIARMNAISNNLASELKDEFQEGRLGLSAAYELSGLPEEKQKEALEDLREKGGLSLNSAKKKKQEAAPTIASPDTSPDHKQKQACDENDGPKEQSGLPDKKEAYQAHTERVSLSNEESMDTNTPNILKYPGSKWRIAKWIVSHFPYGYEKMTYLEPFFGSGAVFFTKNRSIIETINDMDDNVVNLFKVARDHPEELARIVSLTPWSRTEYSASYESIMWRKDRLALMI